MLFPCAVVMKVSILQLEITLLNILVSGLDEEDEQSIDNLDIIANVYEDITNLIESGNIAVTEDVRIAM